MNRVTPHYQITENKRDFPEWGVKILSGDFVDIEFIVDSIGIPEQIEDDNTPVAVKIEYTILQGECPEGENTRLTQTVGWIIEDIVE